MKLLLAIIIIIDYIFCKRIYHIIKGREQIVFQIFVRMMDELRYEVELSA